MSAPQAINSEIAGEIERIGQIYCEVLKRDNREVTLLGRKCHPQILYTFLGYELKAGAKRLTCPDIATARYLKVFTEIGMAVVRVPYDPTRTAVLLAGLEPSLHRIHELLLEKRFDRTQHLRAVRRVYARIRKRCRCFDSTNGPNA
jgi:hypothetical protein